MWFAVVRIMRFPILILEYLGAFSALEFNGVKHSHDDSIHILKAFLLIAIWTLVLVPSHAVSLPPAIEALLAIKAIALLALLRLFDNIVADTAGERTFEGLLCGHLRC